MRRSFLLALCLALCACASNDPEGAGGESPRESAEGVPLVQAPARTAPTDPKAYPADLRDAACVVTCAPTKEASDAEAFTRAFKQSVDKVLSLRTDPKSAVKVAIKLRIMRDTISPGDPGSDNRAVSGKLRGTANATLSKADGSQVRASLELTQPHTGAGRKAMQEHLVSVLGEGLGRALLAKLAP